MARIKVFTVNLGFYESAVAARSQKLALAHWGITRDLFREGTAQETKDPKAVEAAMRKVGLVVRRPLGSSGAFEERAEAEQTLLKAFKKAPAKKSLPQKLKRNLVRKPLARSVKTRRR